MRSQSFMLRKPKPFSSSHSSATEGVVDGSKLRVDVGFCVGFLDGVKDGSCDGLTERRFDGSEDGVEEGSSDG